MCYLKQAAADKSAWPESVRNFTVIGMHKDMNHLWIITLTLEAFAVLMIENNMKKWETKQSMLRCQLQCEMSSTLSTSFPN